MTGHWGTLAEQLGRFDCDPDRGLTPGQVEQCQQSYGQNARPPGKQKSLPVRFLLGLRQPMVLALLMGAFACLLFSPLRREVGVSGSAMVILLVLGGRLLRLWWEDKTQLALARLESANAPKAKVIRSGALSVLPAAWLVPGDIVLLGEGDIVPADGRLTESKGLVCEESALTGRNPTQTVKDSGAVPAEDAPLCERANMVYKGSAVTSGSGRFLVTATGLNTEIGRVTAGQEDRAESPTPLQSELEEGGKLLAIAGLGASGLLFAAGMLWGVAPAQLFLAAAALAVAALPGGIFGVLKMMMARKAQAASEWGVVLRRPSVLETLGGTSVILTDQAGLLTTGRARLRKIWPAGCGAEDFSEEISEQADHLLMLAALCADGKVELRGEEVKRTGDPEETTILAGALARGMPKSELESRYPRVYQLPFDRARGLKTTVHLVGGQLLVVTKGAFAQLLPHCQKGESQGAQKANQKMTENALSVVAVACRELEALPDRPTGENLETGLTLMGLLGVFDPPYEKTRESVSQCRAAGVRTVMLTGGCAQTASALGEELEILREGEEVLDGDSLTEMDEDELARQVHKYSVCAEVTPAAKLRLVRAWSARGEPVAVTGKATGDLPAMHAASFAFAAGEEATDLSKDASQILLTEEGFSLIARAIREGRGAIESTRRVAGFFVSSVLAAGFALLCAVTLGWGLPLLPAHLLLISLIACLIIAPALGLESPEEDAAPAPPPRRLFDRESRLRTGAQGLALGLLTLIGYQVGRGGDLSRYVPPSPEVGATMAFLVLLIGLTFCAVNSRSKKSIFAADSRKSGALFQTVLAVWGFALLTGLIPALRVLFGIQELSMFHHLLVMALALTPLLLGELEKAICALRENGEWRRAKL